MITITRRFTVVLAVAATALLAIMAGSAAAAAQAGTLTIVGSWTGANEASFRAVLADFTARNPGIEVTYTAAANGDVPAVLAGSKPDIAFLQLPRDLTVLRDLSQNGTLKPIDFVVPTMAKNYGFSWKQAGSVGGKLFALPFKAEDDSAFWFNTGRLQRLGVTPNNAKTWQSFNAFVSAAAAGRTPFAASGQGTNTLTSLFENVLLMQQGPQAYDRLARGQLSWDSGPVRDALRTVAGRFASVDKLAGGLGQSLVSTSPMAVRKVFGGAPTAAMIFGGSSIIPVLQTSPAVRPIAQFGVIPFPSMNGIGPARVIGRTDGAVMLKDSPAARALIGYLATPEAATVWAKRGGYFLSPNRKVDPAVYTMPSMRTLATALAGTNAFRFSLSATLSPTNRSALNDAVAAAMRSPLQLGTITARLQSELLKA